MGSPNDIGAPSPQQMLALAVQKHNAGQLAEAEELYRQVLEAQPDQPDALHLLGVLSEQTGNSVLAEELISKALVLRPNFADALSNLGNVLRKLGRPADAVISYQKALELQPDYAMALNNLGNTLAELGSLDEAISRYQEALDIEPGFSLAHFNLANALQKCGRLKDAVNSFQRAIALNPQYAMAWNNLKFAAKALRFPADGDSQAEDTTTGLSDAARATVGFAIQQFYFDGFRPHEADESFANVVAALPAKADQEIPIDGTTGAPVSPIGLSENVVALLHFGRSGTGLMHSLIDGHPEISTLPGIYLAGYFNDGVWDRISAGGWRELPARFAEEFAVLFDAHSPKPIPTRSGEAASFLGKDEGMTGVGEGRNESLSLDRGAFLVEALRLMEGRRTVDPMSFFMIAHAAYEKVFQTATDKHTIFYHIHSPDDFANPNFLRYAPGARMLMMVRDPVQSCESWVRFIFKDNEYDMAVHRILGMLFDIDRIAFRHHDSIGVRMEDLKTRPQDTMRALSAWLEVSDPPTLYEMTAQGKKWWGDPSSPDYDNTKAMAPFDDVSMTRPLGSVFSDRDQFVLATLFYPFSVRFGYCDPDPEKFTQDLKEIRPLIGDMLDFETTMADRLETSPSQFRQQGMYRLFRAGLFDRWKVLDELGDYPHMLPPLLV